MSESTIGDPFYAAGAKEGDDVLFEESESKETPSEKPKLENKLKSAVEEYREKSGLWKNLCKERKLYAENYVQYKKEKHDEKGRIRKLGSSVKTFLLPTEIDVEQISDDDGETATKLKFQKETYNRSKYSYADVLKDNLQTLGFTDKEIDLVVREEVIFDEYIRSREARAEASSDDKEKGLVKKAFEWYRKRPVVQRAAVGAVVGTGAFFVAGSVAPLIGIGSIAITPVALLIRGGTRFAAGIAVGSSTVLSPVLGKMAGVISKIQPLGKDIFSSEEEFVKAVQQYETGVSKKENTKRLATIGAAVLIGASVGGFTSRALGDTLNHIAPPTSGGRAGVAETASSKSTDTTPSRPKPTNTTSFTPLPIKHTGWSWVKDHIPFSKKPTIESQMRDLHIDEKHMAVLAKVQDYQKKGYLSPEEIQKLTESKTSLTPERLDEIALFHPHSKEELLQALHEKFPREETKWSAKDFSKIEFKLDGTILDKNTGDTIKFNTNGKLLITDSDGKTSIIESSTDTTPPKSTDSTPPKSTDSTHTYKLDIGKRGPEGAIIDYFRDNHEVAKQFGWDEKEDINVWAGRKAHLMWLEQAEVATRNSDDAIPDKWGSESAMRHIKPGGKVIIDTNTGKMSFSDDTTFLRPRVINHTRITHAAVSKPSADVVSASSHTTAVSATPDSTLPSSSHATPASVAIGEPIKSQELMKSANLSLEQYNTLKYTPIYEIVNKGQVAPESIHGKTFSYLNKFLTTNDLTTFHNAKKLKELLEDLKDSTSYFS